MEFLRDLRAAHMILSLPRLNDEQASLQFGTTRVFTLMDGTTVVTQIEDQRLECLLMSPSKVLKLMRRSTGRSADFYVTYISPTAERQAEFHNGEKLTTKKVRTSGRYSKMTSRSYFG
jgi:hypothetical protein